MDNNWNSDARSNMIPMAKAEGKQLQMPWQGSGGSGKRHWELLESKGGSHKKAALTSKDNCVDATVTGVVWQS